MGMGMGMGRTRGMRGKEGNVEAAEFEVYYAYVMVCGMQQKEILSCCLCWLFIYLVICLFICLFVHLYIPLCASSSSAPSPSPPLPSSFLFTLYSPIFFPFLLPRDQFSSVQFSSVQSEEPGLRIKD